MEEKKSERGRILYLVVPCYNEQEVLPETAQRLLEKLESLMGRGMIDEESRILFVNDGSKDRTWEMIEELHRQNPVYQGVKLSRNRGHQNALLGGLMTAKEYADMTISLDADLQDDIDVIDQFLEKKDREAQLWEEAGVLEIGLPGGGSVDVELFPEEEWDEELAAYAAEQQADQVYTVTFTEADEAEAQAIMKELADEAGGVFCRDTEDFLPRIKGR